MDYILTDEDLTFEKDFKERALSAQCFDHRGHLQLAWIYISRYGLAPGQDLLERDLRDFVSHVGAADKYNKTLTIAAYQIMYHRMKMSSARSFDAFLSEHSQLQTNFKGILNQYYTTDIFTENAKKDYIQPDLMPFSVVNPTP